MNHVPNILTITRIILTFAFLYLINLDGLQMKVLAASVFFIAGWTDFFDGYFARKYNIISDFGKIMDPIADKFFVLAGFFTFVRLDYFPVWMFVVIAIREVYLTYLRLIANQKGIVLAAESAGKYKTVFQMFTIGFILLVILLEEKMKVAGNPLSGHNIDTFWYNSVSVLMWVVVVLTVYSGLQFLLNNKDKLYVR